MVAERVSLSVKAPTWPVCNNAHGVHKAYASGPCISYALAMHKLCISYALAMHKLCIARMSAPGASAPPGRCRAPSTATFRSSAAAQLAQPTAAVGITHRECSCRPRRLTCISSGAYSTQPARTVSPVSGRTYLTERGRPLLEWGASLSRVAALCVPWPFQ